MEAQWCLALWFMGLENHPLRKRLGQSLLDTQRPDGAWEVYHAAPNGDINTTVEAYAALRQSPRFKRLPRFCRACSTLSAPRKNLSQPPAPALIGSS